MKAVMKVPSSWAYPHGLTGRSERCFVDCHCGHRSYGDRFGAVWTGDPKDAWYQHRLHMDTVCPEKRTSPNEPTPKLSLKDALREIRKILERVEA